MKERVLSVISAISSIVSSLIGLIYTYGGERFFVNNIYGQQIELFGDGIYANNSLMKVGATKGTDIVMLLVAGLLLLMVFLFFSKKYSMYIIAGLQSCLLYSASCLIMGVSYNRLFLLYLVQFSTSLFAFILWLLYLTKNSQFEDILYEKKLKGTAVFFFVGGCSVLVWLSFIIPAVITGMPTNFIEIYTTEPTFAIDLGIILPSCVATGIALLKKRKTAYAIATVLLILVTCVGMCVISQTIIQLNLGIILTIGQIVGMVGSFVILGIIAIILNYKILRYAK